jgi:hypothetical protein
VNAGEVDVDRVTPAVLAGLHRSDTGIGDDDVEPAELVETGLQRALQRRAIPDVASRATIRAPVSSTSLTVAARSLAVAIGYCTEAIWSHRSTAITFAPSDANFTACARP